MKTSLLSRISYRPALLCLCALMTTSILPSANAVTIYKSVGEYGEIKYSQFPPQNATDVTVMELREDGRTVDKGQMAEKTEGDSSANTTADNQQNTDANNSQNSQQNNKDKQDSQELAKRCQNLRNNLTNLSAGGRIYEMDDQGNRKYLDNREIEQRRTTVQQAIQQYCSGQNT